MLPADVDTTAIVPRPLPCSRFLLGLRMPWRALAQHTDGFPLREDDEQTSRVLAGSGIPRILLIFQSVT